MTMLEKIQRLRELVQEEKSIRDLNYSIGVMEDILTATLYIANQEGVILAPDRMGNGPHPKIGLGKLPPEIWQHLCPISLPIINRVVNSGSLDPMILTAYPMIIKGRFWGDLLLLRIDSGFCQEELPVVESAALAMSIIFNRIGLSGQDRRFTLPSRFAENEIDKLTLYLLGEA